TFVDYTVLSRTYNKTKNLLEVAIVGDELTDEALEELDAKKSEYGLDDLTVSVKQIASISQSDADELYQYIDQYIEQKLSNVETKTEDIQDEIQELEE
ncbi:TPA: hypothetical protein ACGO63_002336, partial [Streptococcus suis]